MTRSENNWDELREGYKIWLLHRSHQQDFRTKIWSPIHIFWSWLEERGLRPQDLQANHFVQYSKDLEAGKLCQLVKSYRAGSLANLKGAALRWVRWLYEEGHLLLNPFRDFTPKENPRQCQTRVLTIDEIQHLFELPDQKTILGIRDVALLEVAYGSGLRVGEISRLTLGCLELERRLLHLKTSKNGWSRTVPLTISSAKALKRYLSESRPDLMKPGLPASVYQSLWFGMRKRPLTICGLQQVLEKYTSDFPEPVTFHMLRHSCATHLLKGGAPILQIARLLGHENLESTALYTRVKVEELRSVLRQCHPRF